MDLEKVTELMKTLAELSPQEVSAIWVFAGQLLSSIDTEETARSIASIVLKGSYGTEEEQEAFKQFAWAFALAMDAVYREAKVRDWTKQMEGDRIPTK